MLILQKLRGLLSRNKNAERENPSITEISQLPLDDSFNLEKYNAENKAQIDILKEKYDMNTIQGIRAIPVPIEKQKSLEALPNIVVELEYVLQRKATEHKKNKRMDLAIACLRKSNEIMPFSSISYGDKEYLRLVEYLKLNRGFDAARNEKRKLEEQHPELFFIVHNPILDRTLKTANKMNADLIMFITNCTCPQCATYNHRVYCLSGKDKRFPSLLDAPDFLTKNKCAICSCCINVILYFWENRTAEELKSDIALSSSSMCDMRTGEQKEFFLNKKIAFDEECRDKLFYDYLWEYNPEICPKSFSGYRRMKKINSEKFQFIQSQIVNEAELADFLRENQSQIDNSKMN